jgi:outer membrane receptor protein involved in Fe transport
VNHLLRAVPSIKTDLLMPAFRFEAGTRRWEDLMFEGDRTFGRASVWFISIAVLAGTPAVGLAQIDEIVVTTRKREENLQDVPISVQAFTDQQIQRQGITNLEDISKYSPSLGFDTAYNPTDTRVSIRGLSASLGRSNVAFLVDGIDVTTENLIAPGSGLLANRRLLNDVERIEVVKGSQSALYGRAAFAGAISYITKEPGEKFEGDVRLDAGEDGYFEVAGALGGPVWGDLLGLRMNGVYWTDDGNYQNSVSGENVGGGDGFGTSLTAVFTPGDQLKFKARVEYSDDHFAPQPIVRVKWDTPLPYPEDAFLVGITGGNSRDLVNSDAGNNLAGQGATTESTVTLAIRDHGLYCPEVLDGSLTADQREEQQLALMQMFPDYPRVSDTFVAEQFPGIDPADIPLSLQPIDDGTGNLVQPLVPGFCRSPSYGSANGKAVEHSEDPLTGEEYDGTNVETFRASLLSTWDLSFGDFSLNLGYTDSDSSIDQDQDYQTLGRPDGGLAAQGATSFNTTEQTSVELRFASNWENSPVQLTVGGLYWDEQRETIDKNFITACLDTGRVGNNIVTEINGLCDGNDAGAGPSLDSWQAYRQQLEPYSGSKWNADTEHLSAYMMVEWSMTEKWSLTFEDRYVDEEFELSKPNFSNCSNLAFGIAGGVLANIGNWLDESQVAGFDARCTSDQFDLSTGPVWFSQLDPATQALYTPPKGGSDVLMPGMPLIGEPGDPLFNADCEPLGVDPGCGPYGNIIGSEESKFHVPKVTLEWMPTDAVMLYSFWAKAQKPGGINQLGSGGSTTTIDEERFEPEVMDTYEIGWKTDWQAGGALQFNGALFFQDYTDKQVITQILKPDGQGGFSLNPRIANASAAEVWGLELESTWQPEFLEGLVISGAYTYLDAQYKDFVDETSTYNRAAEVGGCPVVWKDGNNQTVATGVADPNLSSTLHPVADRTYDVTTGDLNTIFAPKCALDLSGNQLERAPKHAFVGNFSLTRPFMSSDFDWFTQVNAIYQGKRFQNADNFVRYEPYWLFDLRLGLIADNVEMLLYVDNVFDDDTLKTGGWGPDVGPSVRGRGFPAGLIQLHYFGAMPDPRQVGIRLAYRFQ